MTKLGEWLVFLTVFFGIYAAILTKQISHPFLDEHLFQIKILPFVLIVLLGVRMQKFKFN